MTASGAGACLRAAVVPVQCLWPGGEEPACLLICAVGVAIIVPATMNWLAGAPAPEPFSIAAAFALGVGGLFVLANRGVAKSPTLRAGPTC